MNLVISNGSVVIVPDFCENSRLEKDLVINLGCRDASFGFSLRISIKNLSGSIYLQIFNL